MNRAQRRKPEKQPTQPTQKTVDINTVPLLQLVAARDQAIQTVRAIDSELARRDAKG